MKRSEATALVATLAAAWPRQEICQATLDIYAHDLGDLDLGVAAQAVETCRRTLTFFPTIAEIRLAAAELQLDAPQPMTAWEQAVNPQSSIIPRHRLVAQARRIVGDDWTWKTEPAHALRRAFLAAYSEVRDEAVKSYVTPEITAGDARELTA